MAKGRVMSLCNPCRDKYNAASRILWASGEGSKSYAKAKVYRAKVLSQPVPEGLQRCTVCFSVKPVPDFDCATNGSGKSKKCSECREYHRKHRLEYRIKNQELRASHIAKSRQRHRDQKVKCLAYYGQRCVCCGETNYEFLTFDHVNDDGAHHRAEVGASGIYRWLIKNNFPATVQVLCWNCQWGKRLCGVCPHQKAKLE
jgi:hypothetical protein